MKKLFALGSILMMAAVAWGCSDSSNDDSGNGGSSGMATGTGGTGGSSTGGTGGMSMGGSAGMTGGTCDGASLCARSLGECGVTTITEAECLAFYDPAQTTCSGDIAAYEACNCDCDANNPTCTSWFSCGEDCFSTHC